MHVSEPECCAEAHIAASSQTATMQDAEMAAQLQERVASVATAEEHSMDVSVSDVFVSAALNQQGTGAPPLVATAVRALFLAHLLSL